MVEFAIVLPVLLLLILGILEFGILIFNYNTISNAAREGARYGIVHPANEGPASCIAPGANSIIGAACKLTAGLNPAQTQVQATLSSGGSGPLGRITISVSYAAQLISAPIIQAVGGSGTINLSTSATMDLEQAVPPTP